jgi:large subunit ribosomal protein L21
MYAIVKIAGKQFRVEKDATVKVPYLPVEPGKHVHFDHVLLYKNEKGELSIGKPLVEHIDVSALVLKHGREKKIIVFHKKRRKGYQKKRGHRQDFTLLQIKDIGRGRQPEKVAEITDAERITKGEKIETAESKTKSPVVKKVEKKAVSHPEKAAAEIKKVKKAEKKKQPVAIKKPKTDKKEITKKKPTTKKK